MALVQWTDSLSVGVSQFDGEHKRLIQMLNELHDAMTQGKGRDVLGKTLNELVSYVATHFKAEERVMEQHAYSGLSAHRVEHEKLTNQVLDFQRRLQSGEVVITISLMNFLRDWLTHHIQQTDQQYTAFLNARGVR